MGDDLVMNLERKLSTVTTEVKKISSRVAMLCDIPEA